jgi:hypothetical protein
MDPEGYWTGFSARIRVIAYNTKLVKADEAPRSVFDFVDPKWRGQVAVADPRFGSTSFHVAALYAMAGDEKMDDFFRRLKANGVRVVDGNSVVRDLVGNPRLLLLDEPLSSLDADLRSAMRSELARLRRELAVTTLYVTHDREDAAVLADRVIEMSAGELPASTRPDEWRNVSESGGRGSDHRGARRDVGLGSGTCSVSRAVLACVQGRTDDHFHQPVRVATNHQRRRHGDARAARDRVRADSVVGLPTRLSRRIASCSVEQPGMIGRDFRLWLIRAA